VTTSLPLAVLLLLAIPPRPAHATTQTFNFTGAQQNFVVPGGVTQVTVEASAPRVARASTVAGRA
jgi:hypothetical protein